MTAGARPALPSLVLTAGLLALGACGEVADDAGSTTSPTATPSSTSTTSPPATTTAPTAHTDWPTGIGPSPTRPSRPGGTLTTPPPRGDAAPIPTDARAYAQDFARAWAARDAGRSQLLSTPAASKQASAITAAGTPQLQACEGAAGSAYCTFTAADQTIVVRVSTQTASAGKPDAVTEVQFRG
jgi:hypothetical protein